MLLQVVSALFWSILLFASYWSQYQSFENIQAHWDFTVCTIVQVKEEANGHDEFKVQYKTQSNETVLAYLDGSSRQHYEVRQTL